MNIDFNPSGTTVECKVSIRVPNCGDVTWTFVNEHSDKFYAGFAANAMAMQMREAIEKMRRDAYEQGWKDARSRKVQKCSYFRRFWDATA
jgi:hypothetical protein